MAVNTELLSRVMDYAEAHPEETDMYVWAEQATCGMICCIAGWAVLMSGHWSLIVEDGLTESFYCRNSESGDQLPIGTAAQYELGLNDDQARHIFLAEDLADARTEVDRILSGRRRRPQADGRCLMPSQNGTEISMTDDATTGDQDKWAGSIFTREELDNLRQDRDTVNGALLHKAMEHIESHPEEHSQSHWGARTSCGTTCCLAGVVAILTGWDLVFHSSVDGFDGFLKEEAEVCTKDGQIVLIEDLAMRELGIRNYTAHQLFSAGTTREELRAIVDLIAGKR